MASLRLSLRFFVMPCSSPPNIDLNPAPICEKALRDRTVRPNTSPQTRWISQPGISFVVTTSMPSSSRDLSVAVEVDRGVARSLPSWCRESTSRMVPDFDRMTIDSVCTESA